MKEGNALRDRLVRVTWDVLQVKGVSGMLDCEDRAGKVKSRGERRGGVPGNHEFTLCDGVALIVMEGEPVAVQADGVDS